MCYLFSFTNVFKFHYRLNNLVFSVMARRRCCTLFLKRNFMKNKLKIGVSKNSQKNSVVTYRKASVDVEVKNLIA